MQPVLRLIEHRALRTVDDLVRDLFAAVRGQIVQNDRIALGPREQGRVELETLERAAPALVFLLLTHAGPDIRVDDIGVANGGDRIVADGDSRAARLRGALCELT